MTQRHNHADVIIAWANGAEIEYRDTQTSPWVNAGVLNDLGWYANYEYRVKPPAKKYRVALFKDSTGGYTSTADNQETSNDYEGMHHFVRWLTDWVEYEEK